MKKGKYLTVRWNNMLTLALGIPSLIYIIAAFSTSTWSEKSGMIGISIVGVLY
ncbi:MAG: hypothetical protein P8Z42_02670 [Anaerolineales bacterium]